MEKIRFYITCHKPCATVENEVVRPVSQQALAAQLARGDAQDAFALHGHAVLLRGLPPRSLLHDLQDASLEPVVGNFELLIDDGAAVGRDLVAQNDARHGVGVAPDDAAGDVLTIGRIGGKGSGLIVAECDEDDAVRGPLAVAGDGLLVGRERLDAFDILGGYRGDLLAGLSVHDVERLLRGGRKHGAQHDTPHYEHPFHHLHYPQNGAGPRFIVLIRRTERCIGRKFRVRILSLSAAEGYSSLSLSRSAFSATIRWSMQSWISPSMKAARL